MSGFPLELISNFLSLIIVIAIFYRFFQYKKKLNVIQGLDELKQNNTLEESDKKFIEDNLIEYTQKHQKQEALIKLVYPLLILFSGILILLFSLQEALIHLNIIVVVFIYLHIIRIHYRNFVNFLKELKA
jgi:Flp pilus assembly protein TadB